jgi:beta-lactamase superfamily II metal-dependent hydrolase
MSAPVQIPINRHVEIGGFLASIRPHHLVFFLLNVGDGDQQVLLLPEDPNGERRLIVVDVAKKHRTEALIAALEQAGLVAAADPQDERPDGSIALVVATHPHSDHIGGMADLLETQKGRIDEFWDPGYFHTTQAYHSMMGKVEGNEFLSYAQPTAGYRKWIGSALVTVLAPSVQLRNRFDTYGTEINDASITLRIEFPAARVVLRGGGRELLEDPNTTALILGADAQTASWAFVETDFPELHTTNNEAAKAIRAATGADSLKAKVLKVSHHGSKHGVNLELVERINPTLMLVSSTADGARHHFPHLLAQEALREAKDSVAGSGRERDTNDWELGILYTSDQEDDGTMLGSIAVVMGRGRATVWRFGDDRNDMVDLDQGRRFVR